MKKSKSTYIAISIFAILCILPFLLAAGCSVTTDDTEVIIKSIGSVTGIVKDADNGDTLFGVEVKLGGKYTLTFLNGQYTIENIEAGEQIISATLVDYKPYQKIINVIKGTISAHEIILEPVDNTAPQVNSVSPVVNAPSAAVNVKISAIFNEPLDITTATGVNFSVDDGTVLIGGSVDYDEGLNKITFTPSPNLQTNTLHTATLKTGIKDVAGNALDPEYSWKFTTSVTGTVDILDPSVPQSLNATSTGSTTINLTWVASTDDAETIGDGLGEVARYEIERDGAIVDSTTGTSYDDESLSPSTQYFYRVRAIDTVERTSVWSTQDSATTDAVDTTPPANVTIFQASPGNGQVTLDWINPGDDDFAGVWIVRKEGGDPLGPDDEKATKVYIGLANSFTDTEVVNGTTYYYAIYTFDESKNFSSGKTANATPTIGTETKTFTPTKDAFIYAGDPGKNYGGDKFIISGVKGLKSNYFIYTLISFEKVNEALKGKKVVRATLRLYYDSQSGTPGDEYFHVHRLNPSTIKWAENTVTWKEMDGFGSFFDATVQAETKVPNSKPALYTWDVTDLVSLWLSDPIKYPNAGLLVKATPKMILDHYFNFHSKENENAPELVVVYVP
jgi:hypothetical protein